MDSIAKRAENKTCADCLSKGPTWASWNIGIFICMRCASIHRSLGAHISKVKSLNLDQWTPDKIENMSKIGNARAKAYYEAKLPSDFIRPNDMHFLQRFIRQKYVDRKYVADFPVLKPVQAQPSSSNTSIKGNTEVSYNSIMGFQEFQPITVPDVSHSDEFKKLENAYFDPLYNPHIVKQTFNSNKSWDNFGKLNNLKENISDLNRVNKPLRTIADKEKLTIDDIMALYNRENNESNNFQPWGFQLQTLLPEMPGSPFDPYNDNFKNKPGDRTKDVCSKPVQQNPFSLFKDYPLTNPFVDSSFMDGSSGYSNNSFHQKCFNSNNFQQMKSCKKAQYGTYY